MSEKSIDSVVLFIFKTTSRSFERAIKKNDLTLAHDYIDVMENDLENYWQVDDYTYRKISDIYMDAMNKYIYYEQARQRD